MRFLRILAVLALIGVTLAFAGGASAQDGQEPIRQLGGPEVAPAPVPASPQLDPAMTDVLPAATPGDEALAALSDADLAAVAAQNGTSVDELSEILANDGAVWLDEDGVIMYFEPPAPAEYLEGEPAEPGPFPNSQTFLLNSKPGSSKVIYLDFDGYALPAGTGWNNGNAINTLPWDTDGNYGNWSQSEHDTIQSIWQRVAEDYAPFDVNVTTQDPGFNAINRSGVADNNYGTRVVITDTPGSALGFGGGGVAYVGVFDLYGGNGHAYYQPAWTFPSGVGDTAHNLAEVTSHEAGHNVGLNHDGQLPSTEYYAGHGMWAPIMGNSYGQPVTQWSRGEYTNPTNTQDDFVVMQSNGLALIPDETGGGIAPTVDVVEGQSYLIGATPVGDIDSFRYSAPCTGNHTFTWSVAPTSPNLSILTQIYNWNGAFLQQEASQPVRVNNDLATGMGSTFTQSLVRGQDYTLAVFPLANGTASTNWTNYANVGNYSLDVTEPGTNDLFACQETIGGPSDTQTGSNVGYGVEAGEPTPVCEFGPDAPANTAWWEWTAPNSNPVTIDTYGSSFDTILAVYTGNTLGSLSQVACNDQALGTNQSEVNFKPTAGTTYRISVDGWNGQSGSITLNTRPAPVVTPGAIGGPEGNSGIQIFPVPVELDRASNDDITLNFLTFGSGCGIGTPNVDYVPLNSSLTIPAGTTTAVVNVEVFGDTTPEPNFFLGEWIPLSFQQPTTNNASLDPGFFGLGFAIVGNDDGPAPPCP